MDYFRIVGEQRYLLTLKKFHSLFLYSLYTKQWVSSIVMLCQVFKTAVFSCSCLKLEKDL